MRCVVAIIWNRNKERAEPLYEMTEQDFTKNLLEELHMVIHTTWWERLKAVFNPPAPPDFRPAIAKTFQNFKNQTIAAHQVRKPEDRPEIDWKYTDSLRNV